MANLALYRKYRSATFAEVIGQDHVTAPLSHALSSGRINHAYLFSGPRGCGKTSSARILARSLNCAQGPTPDPCGVCASCLELAPNGSGSIDVIEIDAASHGGVDDARDLRERAFFAPVRDRYKVYIIDEAHMVTTQGFNALLKLVEEPPDFLVFIFATTEPDKVLTTIRSRTHHYPFRLIPPGLMRQHLEAICAAEQITVEPAVLPLVVTAGGGSARDSLSILDQLLAGAGEQGVTYTSAVALLGVTDAALLDDMVDSLAAGDAAAVYGTVDRVVEAGHDPRRFAMDLLDRFRDLILLDAVPDAAERGLIDAPEDQRARMVEQSRRLGGATLTRCAEIVHTALIEMRGTTSPRLVLELLCARMLLPDASADAAAVLARIERVERRLTAGTLPAAGSDAAPEPKPARTRSPRSDVADGAEDRVRAGAGIPVDSEPATGPAQPASQAGSAESAPAAGQAESVRRGASTRTEPSTGTSSAAPSDVASSAAQPVTDAPVFGAAEESGSPVEPAEPAERAASAAAAPEASAVPGALDSAAIRRLWPEILDVVKGVSRRSRALLDNAQVAEVDGESVQLSAPGALARMIGEESNTSVLAKAMTEVVGGTWKIKVVDGAAPQTAPPPSPAPAQGGPSRASDPSTRSATPEPPTSATTSTTTGATNRDATRATTASRIDQAELDPRDDPDFEATTSTPVDPEAEALRLLTDQLGAMPLPEQDQP